MKEEFLKHVKELAAEGIVTEEEVLEAFRAGKSWQVGEPKKQVDISDILYYIGGAIVFIGIGVLVFQHWNELSVATRILATLGSSIAAYIAAVLFSRHEQLDGVSQTFFLLSALLLPVGLGVVFDEAGMNVSNLGTQSLLSVIAFTVYAASFALFRKTVLMLASVIFGTWLFFAFTSFLVDGRPVFDDFKYVMYRILLVGLSYILLGYAFAKGSMSALTGWLYSAGIIAFLGAALALGGWQPQQNVFWELIFPALALGTVFLSVYLKSRSFLIFGSLFLMGYILKITAEYFTDTLGWPFALVMAGFALIGIGYGTLYLNKRYIRKGDKASG